MKLLSFLGLTAMAIGIATLWTLAVPGHASAACGSLPSSLGTATLTVSTPSAGSYRVWARILAPNTTANSFYLQIPDANLCQATMGNAAIPAGAWTWVDYQDGNTASKVNATLAAGSHTVLLAGAESGVEVDKVLLLTDTACTPTSTGTNCTSGGVSATPTPSASGSPSANTTVTISSGAAPQTVSGTINVAPTNLPANTTSVKYYLDDKPVSSSKIDTKSLSDGAHTVKVVTTTADGKTTSQSSKIVVKNHATLGETLLTLARTYRWLLAGFIVLLIAIPGLIIGWQKWGWFSTLHLPSVSTPAAPSSRDTSVNPVQPATFLPEKRD